MLVGTPASAIAQGAKTRLRGHEELCVGMSEYERQHLAEALGPPRQRIRTYSSPCYSSHEAGHQENDAIPMLQQQDSGFRSLSSGSEDTLEDYSHDLELGSDSEDTETLQHQITNGHQHMNGDRASAVPARLRRRQRYDSESSTIGDEHERAEFQRLVAQRARPSSVLDEVKLRQLVRQQQGRPRDESQRSVLGQIHLEMAKCHENGRFGDTTHPEGKYDQAAAVFHLEQAARCGVLEALLVLAKVHLGLPHDLLEDWTLPESDENTSKGVEYLEQAARAGDRGSMIALAKALDTGEGLGTQKQRNWQDAVLWYNMAVTTTDNDEGGEYDGCMDDPPYLLLARQAELYLQGGYSLERDPATAGELYQEAAAAATAAMKGRLANKYFQLAEDAQQEAC
uniref:Elongation factor 2 kinase n=1 Tax=Rhipicephalus zambeziensis TaxID=60191 RepID=A0A224YY64_9ACAR